MKGLVTFIMCLGLAVSARAEAPCLLLTGGTVWLPGARADKVDVVLRGDRIEALGSGVGAGCTKIDAAGKTITAGFIDPYTQLGLVEISGEDSTNDTELKALYQDDQGAVRAAVRASLGFNPRSAAIPVARLHGVTSAVVVPGGGIVSGDAFWIDLAGETRQAIVREPLAMVANLGARSESRASGMHVFDLALKETALWMKQKAAWEKRQRADFHTSTLDLEALGPVVSGEVPVLANVNRAADIESLLALTEGTRVRLVLVGGAEAWLVAKALAARKIAVIVDPLVFGPGGFDQLRARPDNAALLAAAGVPVMMSVMNTHQVRKLRQVAGNAVREGLRWEDALLAVTERPADAFGLAGYGRIEAKAVANVVIWSGDPFELSTRAERVYIRGVEVPRTSRQTELRDRWRRITPDAP